MCGSPSSLLGFTEEYKPWLDLPTQRFSEKKNQFIIIISNHNQLSRGKSYSTLRNKIVNNCIFHLLLHFFQSRVKKLWQKNM